MMFDLPNVALIMLSWLGAIWSILQERQSLQVSQIQNDV